MLKDKWLNFVLPWIHKAMEVCRNDPETSYKDWAQMCKYYKEHVGEEYVEGKYD